MDAPLGENHWFKLMGGWNIENMDYTSTLSKNTGVIDPEHAQPEPHRRRSADPKGNGSTSSSLVGAFFRVNYGYKGKYLVEVSGRYDGNSKFPSNQRWGFFPSASVGWRISEEPFMAGAKSWLDNLKIRASFGSTGNGMVKDYEFLSKIAINKNLGFLTGDSPLIYAGKPSIDPDGLTWETVSDLRPGAGLGDASTAVCRSWRTSTARTRQTCTSPAPNFPPFTATEPPRATTPTCAPTAGRPASRGATTSSWAARISAIT